MRERMSTEGLKKGRPRMPFERLIVIITGNGLVAI